MSFNVPGVTSIPANNGIPGSQLIFDGTNLVWFDPSKHCVLFDDFVGFFRGGACLPAIGWADFNNGGAGAAPSFNLIANVDTGHPGVLLCNTGTTTTGSSGITLANFQGSEFAPWKMGAATFYFKTVVKIPVLSNGTDRFTAIFGVLDGFFGSSNAGEQLLFLYSDNVNSGNWVIQSRTNNGTITTVNTSVAVNTSWNTFEINMNAAATSCVVKINGTIVATITTNLPTINPCGFGYEIIKSLGTTNTTLLADMFYGFINLTSAR